MKLWAKDWFAALLFSVLFLIVAYAVAGTLFQGAERTAYDAGVRLRSEAPSERVAVVAIDDESIQTIGRWPWPRSVQADMVRKLHAAGAKVVGNTSLYYEAEESRDLAVINELTSLLTQSSLAAEVPAEIETFGVMLKDLSQRDPAVRPIEQAYADSALVRQYNKDIERLAEKLLAAREAQTPDKELSDAIREAGNVGLAMTFTIGRPFGRPDRPLPDYVQRFALNKVVDRVNAQTNGWLPLPTTAAQFPIPAFGQFAEVIGHLNTLTDVDGAVRYDALVLQHYDQFYPSLSLMLAAAALNLQPDDIEVRLGEGVALGNLEIRTTSDLRMYTHFYGEQNGRAPFPVYSFRDVRDGKIPAEAFRDKVVLIGATALGLGDAVPTPVSASMAPVEAMAHAVSSLLNEDFYTRPEWAQYAELAALLLLIAYLALALPRLGPAIAALVSGVLVLLLIGSELYLMADLGIWLKLVIPALLLVTGHLFMTVKRLRITERLKASSEVEGAESNKMLGLAFQGQGQLDMAFEKFRRVQPVDDKLLDLLYNLALDYERKRQFNKAENVYQHIAGHDPKFRDVAQKVARARKLSETVILGGSGGHSSTTSTMVLSGGDSDVEKPMLGRYQVEKELGKGAMGVVYLGKDPKIGRQVAIKTMALSQEFEPDELEDVKSRFFREAETAGRLSHPNIVQIFDAGEEHDLAYIAMEFIRGYDLTRHTKANALLPVAEVVKYVAEAAEALDYAHANGIVHRDIKPANLMLLPEAKQIKVTDFGIARITDASKTKTGMVLGTPSYMSPEQLAGKKVDGRSDLFSLGATLYQLLAGSLPFQADSMATLMFKIANEQQAAPTVVRPDLPPEIDAIVARAMQKDLEQRYQRGQDMARELRTLLTTLA